MTAFRDDIMHSKEEFNNETGNQYTVDDQVSVEELNYNIENGLYAARTATEAKEIAESVKEASDNPVSYSTQTPTDEQKAQARKNIGAASEFANRYVKATMSADYIVPASGAWTSFTIPFNTIEQSISNRFTLSNGVLTYNGDENIVVEIQYNLQHDNTAGTGPSTVQTFLRKNGTTTINATANFPSAKWSYAIGSSDIIFLTKGDTINLYCQYSDETTANTRKITAITTNILIKEIGVV